MRPRARAAGRRAPAQPWDLRPDVGARRAPRAAFPGQMPEAASTRRWPARTTPPGRPKGVQPRSLAANRGARPPPAWRGGPFAAAHRGTGPVVVTFIELYALHHFVHLHRRERHDEVAAANSSPAASRAAHGW